MRIGYGRFLTCPWELFQQHLRTLKKKNFNTISLQHLYNFKKNGTKIPQNSIVLTFDDGYLDNWVFAYPLLKKYGFTGTIFVNPEFVDSRDIIRKNLKMCGLGMNHLKRLKLKAFFHGRNLN